MLFFKTQGKTVSVMQFGQYLQAYKEYNENKQVQKAIATAGPLLSSLQKLDFTPPQLVKVSSAAFNLIGAIYRAAYNVAHYQQFRAPGNNIRFIWEYALDDKNNVIGFYWSARTVISLPEAAYNNDVNAGA